ncbi:unnamed protein product, partial [marine sediment metagenome]
SPVDKSLEFRQMIKTTVYLYRIKLFRIIIQPLVIF